MNPFKRQKQTIKSFDNMENSQRKENGPGLDLKQPQERFFKSGPKL